MSPFAIFSGKLLRRKIGKRIRIAICLGGETLQSNGFDENGIDNEIDSDLRVILRKLTKKDSTTKKRVKTNLDNEFILFFNFVFQKAFGELRDYCDSNESDDKIRGILPFFALHYRKWSTVIRQSVSL